MGASGAGRARICLQFQRRAGLERQADVAAEAAADADIDIGSEAVAIHAQDAVDAKVRTLRAGKAKEALAKVREAEAVPNRSAAEQLTIDRMKAAAAQRAGDNATAIAALEAVYGKAGAAEKGPLAEQRAAALALIHI